MLLERAAFRSNQRTSLDHDAICQRLLLHNVETSICVIDREIKQL